MANEDKQKSGFFTEIEGFLWKMIAGLLSFALLIPFIIDQAGAIFGISPKVGFALIVLAYFMSPLVFFLAWFSWQGKEGMKNTLARNPVIFRFYYAWIFLACCAFFTLSYPYHCFFNNLFILTGVLFAAGVLIYSVVLLRQCYAIKCPPGNQDPGNPCTGLRKSRKLLVTEYLFLISITLLVGLFYFIHAFPKKEPIRNICEAKKKYDLGFSIRALNSGQIASLERMIQERNNGVILAHSLASISGTQHDRERGSISLGFTEREFGRLFTRLDKPRFSPLDAIGVAGQSDRLKRTVGAIRTDSATLGDVRRFEHLMNMPKAIRQKANVIYGNSWTPMLLNVQINGLLLFFITLMFLLTVWFHACLANMADQYICDTRAMDSKILKGYDPAADRELRASREKEFLSQIKTLKTLISVIILLIIPIFKPITNDRITLDKPLWQFSIPSLLFTNTDPVIVKQQPTTNIYPGSSAYTYNEMDTIYINRKMDALYVKMNQSVGESINQSVNANYKYSTGKSKK